MESMEAEDRKARVRHDGILYHVDTNPSVWISCSIEISAFESPESSVSYIRFSIRISSLGNSTGA